MKRFIIATLILASVGLAGAPVSAQAANRAELLQQIEQLTKLITLLQAQAELKGVQIKSVSGTDNEGNFDIYDEDNPVAVLKTNKGVIEIELFQDQMPITAGNFKKLAMKGFYNKVKFHRVIEGFVIQGGDPLTKSKTNRTLIYGTGGPGYTIPDEFVKSDLLTNVRGTISMANSGPNSGGSQFFINLADNTNLDFDKEPLSSKHPVFGRVVSGMSVVDVIGGVETNSADVPLEDVVIKSMIIK